MGNRVASAFRAGRIQLVTQTIVLVRASRPRAAYLRDNAVQLKPVKESDCFQTRVYQLDALKSLLRKS